MKARRPKRYVRVNNGTLKIYDCNNQNYTIIDDNLYQFYNIDKTEMFARYVYRDLGLVLEESDSLEWEEMK